MVSLAAQQWMKEGRLEGILEGRHEGILEGQHKTALSAVIGVLETRFGPVAPTLRARLEALPADSLLDLVKRAVTISSPDALLDDTLPH